MMSDPPSGNAVTLAVLPYWPSVATSVAVQIMEPKGPSSVSGQMMVPRTLSVSTTVVTVTSLMLAMAYSQVTGSPTVMSGPGGKLASTPLVNLISEMFGSTTSGTSPK